MDPNELRKLADDDSSFEDYADYAATLAATLRQAADEIERLQRSRDLHEACAKEATQLHHAAMVEAYEERCAKNRAKAEIERLRAALSTLTEAAIPIDMWLGHLRQDLSNDERKAFADAVCAALSLVQPGDTTSEPTPGQASPGDSASSSRTESEDP